MATARYKNIGGPHYRRIKQADGTTTVVQILPGEVAEFDTTDTTVRDVRRWQKVGEVTASGTKAPPGVTSAGPQGSPLPPKPVVPQIAEPPLIVGEEVIDESGTVPETAAETGDTVVGKPVVELTEYEVTRGWYEIPGLDKRVRKAEAVEALTAQGFVVAMPVNEAENAADQG